MARFVFVLLALCSGALVVLSLLGQLQPDWASAEAGLSSGFKAGTYYLYALLSASYLVLLVASYITLIMWLRRAYYNLHQLPTIHPEYSDGWAAGAWFVPFINFVRPYTIMREVWQDTQRAAVGRIVEPPTWLGWWWAAFVLKLIIGRITWYMGGNDTSTITQEDLLAASLDAGAQVLAAALTWYVIGRCAKFEEQLTLRQQIDLLGEPVTDEVPPGLAADQSDYQLAEGY